ncbi:acetyl-CoA C-acetyltransferase [Bradyrhizobium diazoefficiens]
MSDDVVIVSAARTPVGSFNGAFATLPAHDLGAVAIKAALERGGIEPGRVSEVIMGQILTAAQGQNPARQASIAAGIPVESPAWGVNQLCGSGLRTVALGYQALLNGDSEIVVAGGQESMSMAPHAQYLRGGVKMGALEFIDTMIKDGLWDAFNGYHMGNTAENVARQWQITRAQQDEFAVASQQKAEAAQKAGKFNDEIVPVTIKTRKGDVVVSADEYPRHGATLDAMAKLRPAFEKDGTVTAGSASGINDGAAAVVLMTAKQAAKEGKKPLARIVSWAQAGVDPKIMGSGPIPASRAALKKAGWKRRRPRPDRGQRGLRGAGLRRQQGPRLGHLQGQRQWRCDRDRPPGRRLRRARAGDAAARDAEARFQEGPCHTVHRRRHGYRDVSGARLNLALAQLTWTMRVRCTHK